MTVQITVPTLGESVTEATVAKWLKKVGDTVEADEPVVELETDKVSLEVPAPSAGVLSEILVEDGADVAVGAVLGRVEESAAAAKPAAKAKAYRTIRGELEAYDAGLPDKQEIVALNKCDALDDETIAARSAALAEASGQRAFTLSGVTGSGVTAILRALLAAIDRSRAEAAARLEAQKEQAAKAWTP